MTPEIIESTPHEGARNVKPNLSNERRWAIYYALLQRIVGGKLKKETTTEVSNLFSVHIRTVQRIWKQAKNTRIDGQNVDVSHNKTGKCGRKRVPLDLNQVLTIPLRGRSTIRSLSKGLGVSTTKVINLMKEGVIRRHSNAIKPLLKEEHMRARMQFCVSMLDQGSLLHEPKFVDMYNIVHIDEKWFYMTKKNEKFYLLSAEDEPLRACQSKNYIGKVMFLVAMARPRFDIEGNVTFSGKIGVFPFVTLQPAQRRSRNRDVGTLEMKPITSVKRETIKAYLIEKVIPEIREKWPRDDLGRTIFIQQDNARTHVNPSDREFQAAASEYGFDISLMCQPPNSPDLNILDLGFFNAIQSLQQKECTKTVEELVHAVEKAFGEYCPRMANRVFVTLQLCMKEILQIQGSNKYKIPHINKAALEREGRLPAQVTCDPILVQNVLNILAS